MKNNRLFGILYLLLIKKKVTAKELADYFGVSVRTIYRDIDLLSSHSIPIYTEQGKQGGIQLLDSFQLDKTVLSEEDQQQILFALQSLDKLSSNQYSISDKLQWLFQKKSHSFIDIDFSVWGKSQIDVFIFDAIKQAILKTKRVKFLYFNSYGEKANRTVEPLQICFRYHAWYLFGYDINKKDYRLFKLSRIQDITLTEDTFLREIPDREEYPKTETLEPIVLKIDKCLAYRVVDECEEGSVSVLEDGNYLVKMQYPINDWLYGYLLSFGKNATIIEPDFVRMTVKKKLEEALKNYL